MLDGGPNFAVSDDDCMAITVAGSGKGGINIQAKIAARDISRAKRTEDRDSIGDECLLPLPGDARQPGNLIMPHTLIPPAAHNIVAR